MSEANDDENNNNEFSKKPKKNENGRIDERKNWVVVFHGVLGQFDIVIVIVVLVFLNNLFSILIGID